MVGVKIPNLEKSLNSKASNLLAYWYWPDIYIYNNLTVDPANYYQNIIGILNWIFDLGQADFHNTNSCPSELLVLGLHFNFFLFEKLLLVEVFFQPIQNNGFKLFQLQGILNRLLPWIKVCTASKHDRSSVKSCANHLIDGILTCRGSYYTSLPLSNYPLW